MIIIFCFLSNVKYLRKILKYSVYYLHNYVFSVFGTNILNAVMLCVFICIFK